MICNLLMYSCLQGRVVSHMYSFTGHDVPCIVMWKLQLKHHELLYLKAIHYFQLLPCYSNQGGHLLSLLVGCISCCRHFECVREVR